MEHIFSLHKDASLAATMYCNAHLNSGIVDSAIVLSYVLLRSREAPKNLTIVDSDSENYINAKAWIAVNKLNYEWVYELFNGLLTEYEYRFDKQHPYVIMLEQFKVLPSFYKEMSAGAGRFFNSRPVMDLLSLDYKFKPFYGCQHQYDVDDNFNPLRRRREGRDGISPINSTRNFYCFGVTGKDWGKRNKPDWVDVVKRAIVGFTEPTVVHTARQGFTPAHLTSNESWYIRNTGD